MPAFLLPVAGAIVLFDCSLNKQSSDLIQLSDLTALESICNPVSTVDMHDTADCLLMSS
uniref:Uncharacterized protein n=1 Tax=Rhizophora mucronata TaxID=61149 RepID=A0A2P2JJ17_RHIMU